LPDISRHSLSKDWQYGHTGRGGCRSRPHAAQAWIRNSPLAAASKNGAICGSSVSGSRKVMGG
jgi:hypothetical protein